MLDWYTIIEKEKGQVLKTNLMWGTKKTNKTVVVTIQGLVKTTRTKPNVIKITAHYEQENSKNKTK